MSSEKWRKRKRYGRRVWRCGLSTSQARPLGTAFQFELCLLPRTHFYAVYLSLIKNRSLQPWLDRERFWVGILKALYQVYIYFYLYKKPPLACLNWHSTKTPIWLARMNYFSNIYFLSLYLPSLFPQDFNKRTYFKLQITLRIKENYRVFNSNALSSTLIAPIHFEVWV